ncbi:MAG: hypothetical protein ACFCBW_08590 [Candidatus Competibacterales bacterium]
MTGKVLLFCLLMLLTDALWAQGGETDTPGVAGGGATAETIQQTIQQTNALLAEELQLLTGDLQATQTVFDGITLLRRAVAKLGSQSSTVNTAQMALVTGLLEALDNYLFAASIKDEKLTALFHDEIETLGAKVRETIVTDGTQGLSPGATNRDGAIIDQKSIVLSDEVARVLASLDYPQEAMCEAEHPDSPQFKLANTSPLRALFSTIDSKADGQLIILQISITCIYEDEDASPRAPRRLRIKRRNNDITIEVAMDERGCSSISSILRPNFMGELFTASAVDDIKKIMNGLEVCAFTIY